MTTPDNPGPDAAPAFAPSLAELEQLAHGAVAGLPPEFRALATHVVIRVEDFPSQDLLDAMDIEDPFELTGLYDGVPLTERSVSDPPRGPDVVWLFRRPLLDEWIDRGDVALADLVTHVVVHELAHHFGWSDDDIAAIDRWWE